MAIILNIETSGLICSVSISDNEMILSEGAGSKENDHASQLTNLIQTSLNSANIKITDLQAVAVSAGPGSYTGLRIGVSTAKGICHALKIPLISIPTLRAMSAGVFKMKGPGYLFCPLIDARRLEVFTAIYDEAGKEVLSPRSVILSQNLFDSFPEKFQIIFFGNGLIKSMPFIGLANALFLNDYVHRAAFSAGIAAEKYIRQEFADLAYFEPQYLKAVYTTKSETDEQG